MKKSLLLLGCITALSNAHPFNADVSVGVAANAAHGTKNSGQQLPIGHIDAAPSLGVAISTPISGALGCGMQLQGSVGSVSEVSVADITATQKYAVSAAAGLSYSSGASVFFAGPALQYTKVNFQGQNSQARVFDGFGVAAAVSHQVSDNLGVRMGIQHVLNKSINSWSDESLDQNIGQLTSSMSQISMSVYTDIDSYLLS
ncbi:MAG: hypothetical protein VXW87_03925 [Pseudomonadota bacterium]|nr:hypothetical protein [Pseudomonadota bacterium]